MVVFLWWCTKYCSSTTEYYSVLQSTTPVLLQYYSVLQTTPYYRALLRPLKRRQNDVLPVPLLPGTSFQNEHFVRCFLQFSQNEVPKRAFRAMLPTIFTEKASKRIVSCEASSKFHRRSFQNERFVRGFLQNSQNHASKTSVSHDASDNFARKSFQNDRFVRGFFQISQNKLPKRAFRAMLPTIFTKNLRFATVSRNRHTASCERVHPPKAKCASHYNAVHSQM